MKRTIILFVFAMDYHSGQWSRGYRLLCRCQRRLRRYAIAHILNDATIHSARRTKLYRTLVKNYADVM